MPGPKFDVVVCGSLHLDIMVHGPHLPRPDETVIGTAWGRTCGGKGGNQAVHAARQGARTAFIGRVGDDEFGSRLLANLDAANVDRTSVAVDDKVGSGMSVAIVDADGDYGAVIVSGANLAIDPAGIGPSFVHLGGARVLLLQNEVPHAVNVSAAQAARRAGATVVFNAAPARSSGDDLLGLVDVLVVNRVEAEMLAGVPVSDRASARAALNTLGAAQRTVVVTLGSGGLVVAAPGQAPVELEAMPVNVVSTHGAGDCFLGALASRLADGDAVIDACRFANEAAGIFVSTALTKSER
jgi:ribokinase